MQAWVGYQFQDETERIDAIMYIQCNYMAMYNIIIAKGMYVQEHIEKETSMHVSESHRRCDTGDVGSGTEDPMFERWLSHCNTRLNLL